MSGSNHLRKIEYEDSLVKVLNRRGRHKTVAVKYQLNLSELGYLVRMVSVNAGQEVQGKDKAEEAQIAASQESLMKKGYLREDEHQKMLILNSLMELVWSIFMCEARFSVIGIQKGGQEQGFGFYFYEGRICFIEQQGDVYDLFEIPSLSLAAGMIANRIEIKGETSKILNQVSIDKLTDEFKLGIEKDQIEKQWIFIGKNNVVKKIQCIFRLIESSDAQEMLELRPEKITVSKPGKTDFINACMDCMRKINSTGK